MVRVVGIDPGSRVTGYGVVEGDASFLRCVEFGTIPLADHRSLAQRLHDLHHALGEVLARVQPQQAAVERVFVARSADSALKLGHARGVILLTLDEAGLNPCEYTPAQVKKTVTGHGRAEKAQIVAMMRSILNLDEDPPEDAADALAIALCHVMMSSEDALIAASLQDARNS